MPRGEHLRKVDDGEILSAFDTTIEREQRPLVTPAEIAQELPVTGEAVRQRLHKMEQVEKVELGGGVLWKWKGEDPFAGDFAGAVGMAPATAAPASPVAGVWSWATGGLVALSIVLVFIFKLLPAVALGTGAAYHFSGANWRNFIQHPSAWRENEIVCAVWSFVVLVAVLGTVIVLEELTVGTRNYIPDMFDIYLTKWIFFFLAGAFILAGVVYLASYMGARRGYREKSQVTGPVRGEE